MNMGRRKGGGEGGRRELTVECSTDLGCKEDEKLDQRAQYIGLQKQGGVEHGPARLGASVRLGINFCR
jgi:hypothetical protein